MHEEQWLQQLLRLREEISGELSDLHDGRVVRHSDPASEEAQLLKELAAADSDLEELCSPPAPAPSRSP